jgi:hypothetical protein
VKPAETILEPIHVPKPEPKQMVMLVSECVCQLALVCRFGAAIGGAVFTNCSPSSFSCSSAY